MLCLYKNQNIKKIVAFLKFCTKIFTFRIQFLQKLCYYVLRRVLKCEGEVMLNLKKLKIVRDLKSLKPKFKWLMFSQMQDYKINSNYFDLICENPSKDVNFDSEKIEAMVRETLIKEFSPAIQDSKSYDLLVDAVVHNIKKKQLEEWDKLDNERIV